jgi:hypothetical protein
MEAQEPRSHVRLVASIVFLMVIGASLIGSSFLRTNSASTSTNTFTTTGSSGQSLLSKTWGPWVYEVSMNSTSVSVGDALLVSGELTNQGKASTTIA